MTTDHLASDPGYLFDAEHAVLGGIFLAPQCLDDLRDLITVEDFGRPLHRHIYAAILKASDAGAKLDPMNVVEIASQSIPLVDVLEIARGTPSAANVLEYAARLAEKSAQRRIEQIAGQLHMIAWDRSINHETRINRAEALLTQVSEVSAADTFDLDLATDCRNAVDALEARFNAGGEMQGIPTYYKDVDERLNGLVGPDLIVVGGRPAQGKTTVGMNMITNMALAGHGVLVFSLEMSRQQLMDRMICSVAGVNSKRYSRGLLEEGDWPLVSSAIARLKSAPMVIDDRSGITISRIRSKARKVHVAMRKRGGLRCILVDYLQIVQGTKKNQSTYDRVSEVSMGLKQIAKELNVPLIALAQLNRGSAERADKRPGLHDLKDSGQIEQDADIIMFVHRPEYYDPNTPQKGIAELITAKFRNGEVGTDYLASRLDMCRFDSLDVKYTPLSETIKPGRRRGPYDND